VCGALVLDSSQWYALVRDSSAVHAVDPTCDGQRKVIGCSHEHLAELIDRYTRRRFVDAELWAGKVARALRQHPKGISEEELVRETGLTADQIQRAVMWQNAEAQRWIEQFGQNRGDGWHTRR
jgi:hypothetical protein